MMTKKNAEFWDFAINTNYHSLTAQRIMSIQNLSANAMQTIGYQKS